MPRLNSWLMKLGIQYLQHDDQVHAADEVQRDGAICVKQRCKGVWELGRVGPRTSGRSPEQKPPPTAGEAPSFAFGKVCW